MFPLLLLLSRSREFSRLLRHYEHALTGWQPTLEAGSAAAADAIYSLEAIGHTKDLDAWLARCWRMLKPGGRPLIQSPG
jgi:2-polyprenyl-3-methyl-5-hydroxy-6-metoxy-1,4-benzoquinol methylase